MEWQLVFPTTRASRASSMTNGQSANWRLRIGFVLAAFIGFAGGILLGWYQVRMNSYLSPWLTFFVTMPVVFWGSVLAGLVFNRMLLDLPKLARVLLAILIVAAGVPIGLIWAMLGDGVEPLNLVNSTGATVWNLEWVIAIAGLFGGMWPRWMLPFLRPLGDFALWILSHPLGIVRWIGNTTLKILSAMAGAITWLPRQLFQLGSRAPQNLTMPREQSTPPPTISPPQPRRARQPSLRRFKAPRRKSAVANGNGNGARIVATVEERCPYCFDIVKKNDPRGVKVCDVCHTPHHADCWAIAGKCQVPHLNT